MSFQKIGSQPGKVNFLCLKQRDYLSVWSFFLPVPIPQPNILLIWFLPYEPYKELPEYHGFYIASHQREGTSRPPASFGSVLWSWLSRTPFSAFDLLGACGFHSESAVSVWWDLPIEPRIFPPSLLPASKRDLKALVLYCR